MFRVISAADQQWWNYALCLHENYLKIAGVLRFGTVLNGLYSNKIVTGLQQTLIKLPLNRSKMNHCCIFHTCPHAFYICNRKCSFQQGYIQLLVFLKCLSVCLSVCIHIYIHASLSCCETISQSNSELEFKTVFRSAVAAPAREETVLRSRVAAPDPRLYNIYRSIMINISIFKHKIFLR